MLIGSLVQPQNIPQLEKQRIDEMTAATVDALLNNPVIDEEIRKNPVIMGELYKVVAPQLRPSELRR